MSATFHKPENFIVEIESNEGAFTEVLPAADLGGCMALLGMAQESGRKVCSVRLRGRHISRLMLEAMIRLASRHKMLDQLANSFGLDALDADSTFGHLLIEDAFRVQDFLQDAPNSNPADPSALTDSSASPAAGLGKAPIPKEQVGIQSASTSDSAIAIEHLSRKELSPQTQRLARD